MRNAIGRRRSPVAARSASRGQNQRHYLVAPVLARKTYPRKGLESRPPVNRVGPKAEVQGQGGGKNQPGIVQPKSSLMGRRRRFGCGRRWLRGSISINGCSFSGLRFSVSTTYQPRLQRRDPFVSVSMASFTKPVLFRSLLGLSPEWGIVLISPVMPIPGDYRPVVGMAQNC